MYRYYAKKLGSDELVQINKPDKNEMRMTGFCLYRVKKGIIEEYFLNEDWERVSKKTIRIII